MYISSVFCILLVSKAIMTLDDKEFELTAKNFKDHISKSDGTTVVMFYAPWCPHCQETKPVFINTAKKVAKSQTKNGLALFNCEETGNSDICQEHKIEGYPTIKAFSPGNQIHTFNGDPTEEGLLKFIENPTEFSESGDGNQDADNVPDAKLNHTTYLNTNNFNETLSKTEHALVFFYAPWCPHCQESKPGVDMASKSLKSKGHAIFAVNCEDNDSKVLCVDQNIEGFPTFRYFHKGELFAEYEDELTTEAYLKYLSQPPKEKVKLSTMKEKTESEDAEQKMEFVKHLTTPEMFQKQINEPKHQTMVMYYAPWCSHCQAAKPIYNSAAKIIIESNVNHILAAINCDEKGFEEHCEKEEVTGFPTFIHYAQGKRVKVYEETPLTLDNLVKYFKFSKKEEL